MAGHGGISAAMHTETSRDCVAYRSRGPEPRLGHCTSSEFGIKLERLTPPRDTWTELGQPGSRQTAFDAGPF